MELTTTPINTEGFLGSCMAAMASFAVSDQQRITELKAENARLRAELDRLKAQPVRHDAHRDRETR